MLSAVWLSVIRPSVTVPKHSSWLAWHKNTLFLEERAQKRKKYWTNDNIEFHNGVRSFGQLNILSAGSEEPLPHLDSWERIEKESERAEIYFLCLTASPISLSSRFTTKIPRLLIIYCILSSIVRTFLHWKWCWNIPLHYTWKVAEKRFKMAFMMNKLAMILKLFLKN